MVIYIHVEDGVIQDITKAGKGPVTVHVMDYDWDDDEVMVKDEEGRAYLPSNWNLE